MKSLKFFLAAALLSSLACASAMAQTTTPVADTTPPTITITTPAAGVKQDSNQISVSGTAADTKAVKSVEWRYEGSTRWRKAIMTAPGTASTTWVFTFKAKKNQTKRVFVRAIDTSNNESDTIGRRIQRSRITRPVGTPAATTTTTTTPTTTPPPVIVTP